MTSEPAVRDHRSEALELVERLNTLCGAFLLCLQQGIPPSPEDAGELQILFARLGALAQSCPMGLLGQVLGHATTLMECLRAEMLSLDPGLLETLGEIHALSEHLWMNYPESPSPELETAAARLDGDLVRRLAEVGADMEAPPPQSGQGVGSLPEIPEPTTTEEIDEFSKYRNRPERMFALVFPPGAFASRDALAASEPVDALGRVGYLVLMRAVVGGALALFAAELEKEMLDAIAGNELIEVSKEPAALVALGNPWATLVLGSPAEESGLEAEARAFARQVTEQTSLPAEIPAKPAAHDAAEFEDFDSSNSATQFDPGNLDPEMLQDFLSNAEELLEKLSASILDLEANPKSQEAIEQIFRVAHTIKGTAGMFGFRAIERLTHVMENLFDRVRKGQLTATPLHIDAILFGFDRVRVMFDELKKNCSPELPINDALNRLHASLRGEAPSTPPPAAQQAEKPRDASPSPETSPVPTQGAAPHPEPPRTEAAKPAAKGEGAGTIRVDLRRLDGLVNLVGELVIDRTRFIEIEEELRARSENSDILHRLTESVLLFGRHMNEVQSIIMKIRMVPVGNAFVKFNRMVRDLSRECNKEIDLVIEGGEAELDKTLVEEIGDPLIHLLRNSVDHGIELPEERVAAGKNRRGTVSIRASQDSNMIVICVEDDGRGLQLERIRKKAIQNGLIKESDVLSNKEIFGLIFEPGFSTAEKVTNISGRGVGMDVVKRAIVKLKGVIDIDSTPGKGTVTTIKLPLTLAIIPSLMVECFGESYAIPLVNVIESIRTTPEEIQRIGSADFVRLRERALPLLQMADIFDLHAMKERLWYRTDGTLGRPGTRSATAEEGTPSPTLSRRESLRERRKKPRIIFVVVGVGEKRIGLVVNQLLGQQEIVIKSLGPVLGKPSGVAGGCVLGNGRVALVLDVGEIVDNVSRGRNGGVSHVQ